MANRSDRLAGGRGGAKGECLISNVGKGGDDDDGHDDGYVDECDGGNSDN